MIITNQQSKLTLKELKAKEAKEKDEELKAKSAALAEERYTKEQIHAWSNQFGGIWFLPVINEDGSIEKLALMKPINRHILSHASTKIEDEGLYSFLEACMRECWLEGDKEILEDDDYFIPSAMKFNKIMEGKKVAFLKR